MTRAWRLCLVGLLVTSVAGAGFARGLGEADDGGTLVMTEIDWETLEIGAELTVTGELGVFGNEPNSYLAIGVPDDSTRSGIRLVQVEGSHLESLYELQGQTVTAVGTVTRTEIGPGFPTVVEVAEYHVQEEP